MVMWLGILATFIALPFARTTSCSIINICYCKKAIIGKKNSFRFKIGGQWRVNIRRRKKQTNLIKEKNPDEKLSFSPQVSDYDELLAK